MADPFRAPISADGVPFINVALSREQLDTLLQALEVIEANVADDEVEAFQALENLLDERYDTLDAAIVAGRVNAEGERARQRLCAYLKAHGDV